jgi:hypothetical protein
MKSHVFPRPESVEIFEQKTLNTLLCRALRAPHCAFKESRPTLTLAESYNLSHKCSGGTKTRILDRISKAFSFSSHFGGNFSAHVDPWIIFWDGAHKKPKTRDQDADQNQMDNFSAFIA